MIRFKSLAHLQVTFLLIKSFIIERKCMLKQAWALLKRDKIKLMMYFALVAVLMWRQSLVGPGSLVAQIAVGGMVLLQGLLAYWVAKKPFSCWVPWACWGGICIIWSFVYVSIVHLCEFWELQRHIIYGMFRLVNYSEIILGALFFPFMLMVWGEKTISLDKGFLFVTCFMAVEFTHEIVFVVCSFFIDIMWCMILSGVFSQLLFIVVVYFFWVWISNEAQIVQQMKIDSCPNTQPEQLEEPLQKNDVVESFFKAIIAQDENAIQKMIAAHPHLVREQSSVKGNTALHVAALNGWANIARIILFVDQNTRFVRNAEGKYPWELAQEKGHEDLAQQIK